jgi:hypothetical protein
METVDDRLPDVGSFTLRSDDGDFLCLMIGDKGGWWLMIAARLLGASG